MKTSTEGLENKDEEIYRRVNQKEKYGTYERQDKIREAVQEAPYSEKGQRKQREEIIHKTTQEKFPELQLSDWEGSQNTQNNESKDA